MCEIKITDVDATVAADYVVFTTCFVHAENGSFKGLYVFTIIRMFIEVCGGVEFFRPFW